ncbi:hypothetical protein [Deinococcus daejeonensis]|nr:hypothetical protein [Deinococcus daejeonensis]
MKANSVQLESPYQVSAADLLALPTVFLGAALLRTAPPGSWASRCAASR